jgi:BASS family bile acid:Na+ symporter
MLGPVETALVAVLLLVLMLGMGATLTLSSLRELLRNPRPVWIGFASQVVWMPLTGFALARTLGLSPEAAIGLVVVASCPGGTTSNMLTYFARGDVALSICMTTLSTLGAVVTLPLLLFTYATPFTSTELTIPYAGVIQALLATLIPVSAGALVRRYRPAWARKLERIGSMAGAVVIVLLTGFMFFRSQGAIFSLPASMLLAPLLLGLVGMALGHGTASVLGLRAPQRRAIALEVGVQNSALAIAIVLASFAASPAETMVQSIVLYALFTTVTASLATFVYRRGRPLEAQALHAA